MSMKPQSRVLGIDDAPFHFGDESTAVVCAVVRLPHYLEGVMVGSVAVDGTDANDVLIRILRGSRYAEGLSLIFVDGVALGGFNVVDIDLINRELGIPVVTVTRDQPDIPAMVLALKKNFGDWERRAEIIGRKKLQRISTGHKPIFVTSAGIAASDLREAVGLSTVRGVLPEPIRIAHLIATAIAKGESHGRA